jgi:hypothetical protein
MFRVQSSHLSRKDLGYLRFIFPIGTPFQHERIVET